MTLSQSSLPRPLLEKLVAGWNLETKGGKRSLVARILMHLLQLELEDMVIGTEENDEDHETVVKTETKPTEKMKKEESQTVSKPAPAKVTASTKTKAQSKEDDSESSDPSSEEDDDEEEAQKSTAKRKAAATASANANTKPKKEVAPKETPKIAPKAPFIKTASLHPCLTDFISFNRNRSRRRRRFSCQMT